MRLATIWLDGCSGCHMSLLDIDEALLDLAPHVQLVFGPLVDAKEFPEDVDAVLVEGAVSSEEDLRRVLEARERSRILVALGDCAVTSNVPGMRNLAGAEACLQRAYGDAPPREDVPGLLPVVRPVHQVVKVDLFLPGCPPSSSTILQALTALLEQREPEIASRFGA